MPVHPSADSTAKLLLWFQREPSRYRSEARRRSAPSLAPEIVLKLALGRRVEFADPALAEADTAAALKNAAVVYVRELFFRPEATPYQTLGVEPAAPPEQIRECFRLLMQLVHPDRQDAQTLWPDSYAAQANRAYAVLRDEGSRARFDAEAESRAAMARAMHKAAAAQAASTMPAVRRPPASFAKRPALARALWPEWLTARVFGYAREHPATVAFGILIAGSVFAIAAVVVDGQENVIAAVARERAAAKDAAAAKSATAVATNPTPLAKETVAAATNAAALPKEAAAVATNTASPKEAVAAAERAVAVARDAPEANAPSLPPLPEAQRRDTVGAAPSRIGPAGVPVAPRVAVPAPAALPIATPSTAGAPVAPSAAPRPPAASPAPQPPIAAAPPAPSQVVSPAPAVVPVAAQIPAAPPPARVEPPAPGVPPSTAEVEALLAAFVDSYERGRLDAFAALFDDDAESNQRRGRAAIRGSYDELFRATEWRRMQLTRINWRQAGGRTLADGEIALRIGWRDGREVEQRVNVAMELVRRDGRAVIARLSQQPRSP